MNKRENRLFSRILLLCLMSVILAGCGAQAESSDNSAKGTEPVSHEESVMEGEPAHEEDGELNASADTQTTEEAPETEEESKEIILDFGTTTVTAVLNNSETTKAFLERLPLTISMNRYADREYYAAIPELPENGEDIPDFENGDITYYTAGKSLAIFFGNAENSSQSDLIRMGRITSDLDAFDDMADSLEVTISLAEGADLTEGADKMTDYDFTVFTNVELSGVDLDALDREALGVLYQQARYCQAMTEADTDTMREIASEDMVFTHMSGRQQTREEYFADIEDGSLAYFTIGMEDPVVEVNGEIASVTYTSVLDANAYGAKGVYRMGGTHWFEKRDGEWIAINNPEN